MKKQGRSEGGGSVLELYMPPPYNDQIRLPETEQAGGSFHSKIQSDSLISDYFTPKS
jgi:hypothetical protein